MTTSEERDVRDRVEYGYDLLPCSCGTVALLSRASPNILASVECAKRCGVRGVTSLRDADAVGAWNYARGAEAIRALKSAPASPGPGLLQRLAAIELPTSAMASGEPIPAAPASPGTAGQGVREQEFHLVGEAGDLPPEALKAAVDVMSAAYRERFGATPAAPPAPQDGLLDFEPCDWCGKPIVLSADDPDDVTDPQCWIGCTNDDCSVRPQTARYDNEDDAHAAWDDKAARRTPPTGAALVGDAGERVAAERDELASVLAKVQAYFQKRIRLGNPHESFANVGAFLDFFNSLITKSTAAESQPVPAPGGGK